VLIPSPNAEQTLRQQAELRIQNKAEHPLLAVDLTALAPAEIQRMCHELQVHQIELTMQNEELRRAHEEIDAARARYFDLYDCAPIGYCTLSETGLILEINLTAALMLGVPKSALIEQSLTRFILKDDQDCFYMYRKQLANAAVTPRADLIRRGLSGASHGCELRMVKVDGSVFWARLEATIDHNPLTNPWSAPAAAPVSRVVLSDITALKEYQQQLEHIAYYDTLTTLPNRVLLADRLLQDMAQTERRGQRLAVVYLDLDGFKTINDTYGHDIGDQFLIRIAAQMKQTLRQGDTLARLGGDEFIAVLADLTEETDSEPLLARLLAAASQPVLIGAETLQVSASIGVTFYPQAVVVDGDQLLRQADQAMYQVKVTGKNHYHFFDLPCQNALK
jgi:diguanylate cyclase (GGDEF)-like protein